MFEADDGRFDGKLEKDGMSGFGSGRVGQMQEHICVCGAETGMSFTGSGSQHHDSSGCEGMVARRMGFITRAIDTRRGTTQVGFCLAIGLSWCVAQLSLSLARNRLTNETRH